MATFSIKDFDAADPQAFYLLGSQKGMEALSDATLVVEGTPLPVHSQVLSLQSGVLCGLFTDFAASPGVRGAHQSDTIDQGARGLVLEEPFNDCSLLDMALFLRFAYRPRDPIAGNLTSLQGSLPGLLRLADKLDAPQILEVVCKHMEGSVSTATKDQLVALIETADRYQQADLHLSCVTELARRLAGGSSSLAIAFAEAAQLRNCDKDTLLLLVGLMAAAAGQWLTDKIASSDAAAVALQQAANIGSLEWTLELFSEQPAVAGQVVRSPWFTAAGREWRLQVYPGGNGQDAEGHLSVYLAGKENVKAIYSLTVVEQASPRGTLPHHVEHSSGGEARLFNPNWGYPRFMTLEKLRSRPGYLAGDRLVLRARVEVVP